MNSKPHSEERQSETANFFNFPFQIKDEETKDTKGLKLSNFQEDSFCSDDDSSSPDVSEQEEEDILDKPNLKETWIEDVDATLEESKTSKHPTPLSGNFATLSSSISKARIQSS